MTDIYKLNKFFLFLIIIIIIYSYFYNLSGDLSYLKRYADFADEGYWLQNPINKIKYNTFLIDDQSQSFFGAPIYNYANFYFLKIFGISFYSARFLSVFILFLTFFILYKILLKFNFEKITALTLSISFILLYDNRIYYQWSTPIPLEIFFQSLFLYFVMFNRLNNYVNIIILFFIFLLCYNSKATSIFLIPLSIILITYDNYKDSFLYRSLFLFILFSFLFFFLRNYFLNYYYHNKYQSFNKFLFTTINLDFKRIIYNLNPYIILRSSLETFKFPNSTLIYSVIILSLLQNFKKIFNLNSFLKFISNNRAFTILITYIIFYITYLFALNSYGIDRRQINLILPFYLLFLILLPKINITKKYRLLFFVIFINLFIIQTLYAYKILQFDSILTSRKIGFFILMIFLLVISSFVIFFKQIKQLFIIFLLTNLIFHLIFNRNSSTLIDANNSISDNNTINSVFTGVNAHQLSIENNLKPIWWLNINIHTTYPDWNSDYSFFNKDKITVISSDVSNNSKNGYFNLVPIDYTLLKCDTIYLYPKFDKTGYLDTNLIKYYKYIE